MKKVVRNGKVILCWMRKNYCAETVKIAVRNGTGKEIHFVLIEFEVLCENACNWCCAGAIRTFVQKDALILCWLVIKVCAHSSKKVVLEKFKKTLCWSKFHFCADSSVNCMPAQHWKRFSNRFCFMRLMTATLKRPSRMFGEWVKNKRQHFRAFVHILKTPFYF